MSKGNRLQTRNRASNDAYITINQNGDLGKGNSSRLGKRAANKRGSSHCSDSKKSLNAISVSADPARAGSALGAKSSSKASSIIGMLSERLKSGGNHPTLRKLKAARDSM